MLIRPESDFTDGPSPALLAGQLRALGLSEGDAVIVHASLRAVGPVQGGGEGLLRALQLAIGPSGTIVAPAFYWGAMDPAGWRDPPCPPEELEAARARLVPGGPDSPIEECVGVFPRIIKQQSGALRDAALYFIYLGAQAEKLMSKKSIANWRMLDGFKGLSESNGWVLLLGVDFRYATSVHCAEDLAELPYIVPDEPRRFLADSGEWQQSKYEWNCSRNFNVIMPLLKARGLLHSGKVGEADSLLARHNDIVAAALSLLAKDRGALLCGKETCVWCPRARNLLQEESN